MEVNKSDLKVLRMPVRKSKLAKLYNVDVRKITDWFKNIGIVQRSTLLPGQIQRFIDYMDGLPEGWVFPYGKQLNIPVKHQ